jgi:hypothetical protein
VVFSPANDIEFSGERKRVRCNEGLGYGSSRPMGRPSHTESEDYFEKLGETGPCRSMRSAPAKGKGRSSKESVSSLATENQLQARWPMRPTDTAKKSQPRIFRFMQG